MIEIKITDPNSCDRHDLHFVIDYLRLCAGRVHPDDNPATGAPSTTPLVATIDPPVPAPPVVAPSPEQAFAAPKPPEVAAPSIAAAAAFSTAPEAPASTSTSAVPVPPIPVPSPASMAPPVAAPPTPPAPAVGTPVDIQGMPWDGRIHSSSKEKIADGSWRKRRNTPPETVAQVEAELRATMAAPVPPAAASVPPAPPAPAAPGAPVVAMDEIAAFQSLMQRVVSAQTSGKLLPEQVSGVLAKFQIPVFTGLLARPDLVPGVSAEFEALGV